MTTEAQIEFRWDQLDERYRVILCDIWGVVHDGVTLNPCAADRLARWRQQGRFVLLVTNAPRTADDVARQLEGMGLPASCYDAIVTGGDAGIAALKSLGRPVGFLGTPDDRTVLTGNGVRISNAGDFADAACAGLERERPRVEQYVEELESWAARGVLFHCLNADRVVMHGDVAELCAGALADRYEQLGGRVAWYGKPYPAIYNRALGLAGDPLTERVLAVGDGLRTDMLGAARMGFDAVFVSGGIHGDEPFPADFALANGLGDWRPLATVTGLA